MAASSKSGNWVKSSTCESSACLEVNVGQDTVGMRDSTKPDKVLEVDRSYWIPFVKGLRAGEFTLD